jgi:3-methylcrotonyl-CoA carboxylase alpha subunit
MEKLVRDLFHIGEETFEAGLSGYGKALYLELQSGAVPISLVDKSGPIQQRIAVDGKICDILLAQERDRTFIAFNGRSYEIVRVPAVSRFDNHAYASALSELRAPMPGKVVSCPVKTGDIVAEGDPLLIIESMKLETTCRAWRSGRIAAVHVVPGQNFERDRVLLAMDTAKES